MPELMKVRVTLTVIVDRDAWEREYGIPSHEPSLVRDDVKQYVSTGVRDMAAVQSGAIVEVRG